MDIIPHFFVEMWVRFLLFAVKLILRLVLLFVLVMKREIMKKTLMSLAVASVLISGSALAAIGGNGQADNNDASQATLNFTGKVTSSLCQVATSDIQKDIQLGEVSSAALKAQNGRGPSQTFSVDLVNCDGSLEDISYVIQDQNGSNSFNYLVPKSSDTAAKGVGVYIQNEDQSVDINVGDTVTQTVVKDPDGNALPSQSIPLSAYIGTITGTADAGTVTAGLVDATGVMTIRATAAANPNPNP